MKEYLQIRIDETLKSAVEIAAKNNHVAASAIIRMALASYEPVREVLEELKKEEDAK